MNDNLIIDGKGFRSRLFIGTGKHKSLKDLEDYIISSESEMITVAIRRLDLDDNHGNDLLSFLIEKKLNILPNTAGCKNIDEIILTCELSRELITIRNLLDMRSTLVPTCGDRTTTSLYPCQTWASSGGALVYADDQLSACIQAQVADSGSQPWYNGEWQPGNFYYSNCDTQLLGEILFRATGQDPFTYASTHLFSKLNMNAFWWRDNTEVGQANGNYLTYCCLDATTSDFAKFGQMILNGGQLGGQRIVSQNYIDMIKNITMDSNIGNFSYGLKFWTISTSNVLNSAGESTAFPPANTIYSTIGFDGQYIVIDFENDMVIARNSFYHPIENNNSQRKMKLLTNDIDQSSCVATVPGGLGAQYSPPSGNSFSIQQLLLKVNESLN